VRKVLGLTAAALATLLTGCGSKGSPVAPGPQASQSQVSVRVDGAAWTPALAFVTSTAGNTSILASDADRRRFLTIMFSGPAKVGVHRIEYAEDLPVSVFYSDGGGVGPAWTSFTPIARGEVNVTAATDRTLSGTLSVVLTSLTATTSEVKTIEGTFALTR
jgi:hypothetical protein